MGSTWHHPKTKTSMDNQTRLRVGRQTANQVGIVTWYITSEQCIILYLADPSINFNFATTYYICYQKTLNICMHGIKLKKKAHGEGPEHAVTIPLLWQGGKSSGYEGASFGEAVKVVGHLWHEPHFQSLRRDMFFSVSFFITLATAISKSSCVTCTLLSRRANMPASVQTA